MKIIIYIIIAIALPIIVYTIDLLYYNMWTTYSIVKDTLHSEYQSMTNVWFSLPFYIKMIILMLVIGLILAIVFTIMYALRTKERRGFFF